MRVVSSDLLDDAISAISKKVRDYQHYSQGRCIIDECHLNEEPEAPFTRSSFKHLEDNLELHDRIKAVIPGLEAAKMDILQQWWHQKPSSEKNQLRQAKAMSQISFTSFSCLNDGRDKSTAKTFREIKFPSARIRHGKHPDGIISIALCSRNNEFDIALPYAHVALYLNHQGVPVVRQVQGITVETEREGVWKRNTNPVSQLVHGHQILYYLAATALRAAGYKKMGIITSEANTWVKAEKDRKHMNVTQAVQTYDACAESWGFDSFIHPVQIKGFSQTPVYRLGSLNKVKIRPLGRDELDRKTAEICHARGIHFDDREERKHNILNTFKTF